ncbi:MAG: hypothetical protein P8164_13340 [Gammaproteobacteria bacterium]
MIHLIKMFWDICALKAAPQDLPASSFLLGLALLAYFVTGVVVAAVQWPLSQAVPAALLDTGFVAVLCRILLWTRMLSGRFVQTLTAMAGSGTVMTLIAVPLVMWQSFVGVTDATAPTLPTWLLMIWMVWNVVVVGHILRHALSTFLAVGIGLAVVYGYLTFELMRIFLPH